MSHSQDDLELAIKHVKEAEAFVAQQRVRIDDRKSKGLSTVQSERMLQMMQNTLSEMKSQLGLMTDKSGNLSN